MLKRRKKFDYSKKKYSNPFFQNKRRKRKHVTINHSWSNKTRLIIISVLIVVVSVFWFVLFSKFFNIKTVEVHGNKKISENEIMNLTWEIINKDKYALFKQNNINVFYKNNLINKLSEKYYLEKIEIDKNWPDKIIINLEEKNYTIVWLESDNYYYIDNEGNIFSEADPLDIKQQHYPFIENKALSKVNGEKVNVNQGDVNYIIDLFNNFKHNYNNLAIDRFILDEEMNTVKLSLIDGPTIYFNTENNIEEQIKKLMVIMDKKIKNNFSSKTYIDLRYGDRVYYR